MTGDFEGVNGDFDLLGDTGVARTEVSAADVFDPRLGDAAALRPAGLLETVRLGEAGVEGERSSSK